MEGIMISQLITHMTGEDKLPDLLNHHYGITLLKAKPVGGVLKIKTDRGSYALKRVRKGEKERWKMLNEFRKYLIENPHTSATLPIETNSGKSFFNGFRFSYVLTPWVRADPISFQNAEEWRTVAASLAHIHQASKDFTPSLSYRDLVHTGKWMNKWDKEVQLTEVFHLAAKWTMTPTEVDTFWLRTASYTTSVMENLMEYYSKIDGDKICKETAQYGKLCHGNLHSSNILQSKGGAIQFVDWNEAVLDVRSRDVADLLIYSYGKTGSKNVLRAILEGYRSVLPLTEEEYSLIYARFLYPERLIRTLESIYEQDQQEKNQEMAIGTIRGLTKVEEKKALLLEAYASLLKEAYQITIPILDWLHQS